MPTVGTDAASTTSARTTPTASDSSSAMAIANVKAASTAATSIPTMGRAFPRAGRRKPPGIVSARARAPVDLTGVLIQRRGQDRPRVTARKTLGRLCEGTEPRALGFALRTRVRRPCVVFDSLRMPAVLTQDLVHAVPL